MVQDKSAANLSAGRGVALRELSFKTGEPDYTLFVDGKAQLVEIALGCVAFPSGSQSQVEIRVDGQLANRVVVGPDWQRLHTLLPAGRSAHPHRIDLHVSPTWVPAEVFPGSSDPRVIGVKVGELKVIM